MNITKKRLLAAALIVVPLGAVMAQSSFAGNGAQVPFVDKDFEVAVRKFMTKRFCNRIDATDEQREKLNGIFSNAMEETRPDREQLRHGVSDLSSLMVSDKATDEQITSKVHELRTLREKLMDKRLSTALAVRKVLTAEQREKINGKVQEFISGGNLRPRKISMLIDAATSDE